MKYTEKEFFRQLTSLLINYSIYITEKKGLELKYEDIQEFQVWLLEKQKQIQNGEQESIQLDPINKTQE